jgi:uncharacterized protein (TIGR02217 family)
LSFIFYPTPTPVFPVLPPLAWSVHKKYIMASRSTIGATGRENRLACAVYPRWAFTLTYGGNSWLREQTQNITPDPTLAGFTELEQLTSLFLICRGSYGEFYYLDPEDSSRTGEGVAVANGVITTFPLFITWQYTPPGISVPLSTLVSGIQSIDAVYFNGILQSSSLYSVDSTNTQIVFNTPPANGITITADFHFYFRCRFLDDTLTFSQFDRNLWEVKEVRFESVKP